MNARSRIVAHFLGLALIVPVVSSAARAADAPGNPLARPGAEAPENPLARRPAAALPDPLVLEPASIRDPLSGVQAVNLLVPQGWKVHGELTWRYDRPGLVANASRIVSADGATTVRWMPLDTLVAWPEGLALARQYGTPAVQNGSAIVARKPNPKQYVLEYALPQRKLGEVRVVEHEDLPQVAKAISEMVAMLRATGAGVEVSVGRTRIAYEQDGRAMEEDVFCSLVYMWSPQITELGRDSGFAKDGMVQVLPERLYSISAPKGQLDGVRPLGQMIVVTARHTVEWDALLLSLEAIRQKGELDRARIRAAAQDEINATLRGVIAERQKAGEKAARAFDGYIRTHYAAGPDGTPHPLPPGMQYGWVGPTGNIIGSNNPALVPPPGYTMLK